MRSIDETVGLSAVPKFCTIVSVASIALAMGVSHKWLTWWLAEWHAYVVQRHSELGQQVGTVVHGPVRCFLIVLCLLFNILSLGL